MRVRMKLESSWRRDTERQSSHIWELGLHPKAGGGHGSRSGTIADLHVGSFALAAENR